MTARACLILAGWGLLAGAALHVAVLIGGAVPMAFVGAPAYVVRSVRDGTRLAPVTALGIAALLGVFALYAFSGAGAIRRLPLLRLVLAAVAIVFVLRGLLVVPMAMQADLTRGFDLFHVAASLFVLILGVLLAAGLRGLRR